MDNDGVGDIQKQAYEEGYKNGLEEILTYIKGDIARWEQSYQRRLANPVLASDYKISISSLEYIRDKIEDLLEKVS